LDLVKIEPFDISRHLEPLVKILELVHAVDDNYPPSQDVENTSESFTKWLLRGGDLGRWVSTLGNTVLGHVSLSTPAEYLEPFFSKGIYSGPFPDHIAEISKLFVDPNYRSHGVGSLLLSCAKREAWLQGRRPALAVVLESKNAIRLYRRDGMENVGEFEGIHGTNFVYVDRQGVSEALNISIDGKSSKLFKGEIRC